MQTATEPHRAIQGHQGTNTHRPTESAGESRRAPPGTTTGSTTAGTLTAAFSNQDAIKRSELYKLEIETAKAEEREPVRKKLFFQLVNASGYYLKKKRDAYYYCAIEK